jgi:hypothetical protein
LIWKKEDETINTISNNADEQGRLKILSAKERDFINNAIYEEMKIKGRKLVKCEMKEVLKIALEKRSSTIVYLVRSKKKETKNVMSSV